MKQLLRIIVGCALALQPLVVSAQTVVDSRGFSIDAGFDPNAILTDNDVFDVSRMTKSHLQSFLSTKGALNDVQVTDIDGVAKAPSEIIWRVALSYKLNPQFLLALLQIGERLINARKQIIEIFTILCAHTGSIETPLPCSPYLPRLRVIDGFTV